MTSDNRVNVTVDPYKELPLIKDKIIWNQRLKLNSSAPFIPTFVKANLTQTADPGGTYANRIQGRQILLENPARDSRAKKERDEKRIKRKVHKERQKMNIIGRREAKEKGVWRFDNAQAKFELFIPLHHLWMGYMSELLGLPSVPLSSSTPSTQEMPASASMHPKLVKADFHGSILTVRQSKNPSLIGVSGIVIHETENTFKVVTRKDQVKILPKQNSIFAFAVPLYSTLSSSNTYNNPFPILPEEKKRTTVLDSPHIEFDLYGNQFRFRSADRAGRKFKHKETIEL